MLLTIAALFFLSLAALNLIKPVGPKRLDPYFYGMLIAALVVGSFPLREILFEYKLARAASKVVGNLEVDVNCLSTAGGFWHYDKAGFVQRHTGNIKMHEYVCDNIRTYLRDPEEANKTAILNQEIVFALHVLTHEAMHVARVYDELKADCKAFQRNHRMAEALGVPPRVAAQTAIVAHRFRYKNHAYYNPECEPGGPLDDKLPDAVWMAP